MIHRYFAGTLGLLIAAIFFLSWRLQQKVTVLPTAILALADLGSITTQLRPTERLVQRWIGSFKRSSPPRQQRSSQGLWPDV